MVKEVAIGIGALLAITNIAYTSVRIVELAAESKTKKREAKAARDAAERIEYEKRMAEEAAKRQAEIEKHGEKYVEIKETFGKDVAMVYEEVGFEAAMNFYSKKEDRRQLEKEREHQAKLRKLELETEATLQKDKNYTTRRVAIEGIAAACDVIGGNKDE